MKRDGAGGGGGGGGAVSPFYTTHATQSTIEGSQPKFILTKYEILPVHNYVLCDKCIDCGCFFLLFFLLFSL